VAGGVIVNEAVVMNEAGAFESRMSSFTRSDAPGVWWRYRQLRARSLLRIGTVKLGWRVKDWHVAMADDLIADYLSDTPTIREGGWKQAKALLGRAAQIAPRDGRLRARQRYCEGQLARIDAEALRERGAAAEARGKFNTAQRAFQDAARGWRGWPDPHLGLARVAAIGFADVDATRAALDDAERDGYRLGSRETATLADAHRLRGERTWPAIAGLPDEPRYLARIRSDCERALELYDQVPAYGEVSRNIRRVHQLLARVDAREQALTEPAPEPLPAPTARPRPLGATDTSSL
jgi:hypothetical protein